MTLLIAALALLFTIASFWWLNARPGRLIGSVPTTFAMILRRDNSRFRMPVVIYNTGAKTMVVESLRLALLRSENRPLEWISTRDRVRPTEGEKVDFSAPFAVDGRRAVQVFAEFGETPTSWNPEPGSTHRLAIQARVLGARNWRKVVEFPLQVPDGNLDVYITHRNRAAEAMLEHRSERPSV